MKSTSNGKCVGVTVGLYANDFIEKVTISQSFVDHKVDKIFVRMMVYCVDASRVFAIYSRQGSAQVLRLYSTETCTRIAKSLLK